MRRFVRRILVAGVLVVPCTALTTRSVAAHGVTATAEGLAFPLVIAGVVGVSLLGGGLVPAVYDRVRRPSIPVHRLMGPLLVLGLGGTALALALARSASTAFVGTLVGMGAVYLARDAPVTDCGVCADAALGAVTLHRGLEGAVLATVYAADAALGLAGALVVAGHATAETAAVASLYAPAGRRYALGAVLIVQAGFVLGAVVGVGVVDAVPAVLEAVLLALVGGVLLAVGAREAYARHLASAPPTPV
jgi:zinc transporter ZupT